MGRKIAIIGTAGRDKNYPLSAKHWDFMCNTGYTIVPVPNRKREDMEVVEIVLQPQIPQED